MSNFKMKRRDALRLGSAAAATAALTPLAARRARAQNATPAPPEKYLFVICAAGGGNVLDSFLSQPSSQSSGGNAFQDDLLIKPNGSNLYGVSPLDNSIEGVIGLGNGYSQGTFLQKHYQDVAVFTHTGTSVNHVVAAKRSLTGNDYNQGGITLQEAMALRYGSDMILPNCNMSGGGYLEPGVAPIAAFARAEPVQDPRLFPFATHGTKGIQGAPSPELLTKARSVREQLEDVGSFKKTFRRSELLGRYRDRRREAVPQMEGLDLIKKLMLMQNSPETPLDQYGLETSSQGQALLEKFPTMQTDAFVAQGAMAFLLARNNVATAITISPGNSPVFESQESIINAPIAFDWSHRDHRGGQNAMWGRILKSADALIDLLKEADHVPGDPSQGKMWDRSLIYFATEFGRDRVGSGGSGHHLNNGSVIISPMINGNQVYGGVDPATNMTYGFDPATGAPDPGREMEEADIYSALCHALDIDFPGRRNFPTFVRGA